MKSCLVQWMVVTLLGVLSHPVSATDNQGWFEVTRGMAITPMNTAQVDRLVDRLWIPQPGDTLASIALATTGDAQHAFTIARYNQLNINAPLSLNSVVRIPHALLLAATVSNPVSLASSRWEIQEYLSTGSKNLPLGNYVNTKDKQTRRNRSISVPIKTINVDMFAGEVKVLGRVEVTRVAIGNGDIVRAEVLKNGELLVIAQTSGSTSLRLWHTDDTQSDYNIRVSPSDPETRIRMEPMVRMRVRMIEFRKSALGKLGIDWSDSANGPGFGIAGDLVGNPYFRPVSEGFTSVLPNTVKPFQTYFGIASNITSRINFLASTGDAITLAEPVLSTTSGGSASFLAGGEVPYPSIGANGQTIVQFKEYGIKLNVSPSIDALGNVRTVVETEISQLDPAVSVQGAPGLLTRRAQTQVNVRSGDTIVISGLLSSDSSKDIDKIPGIGNLPIIGSLFRSRNARNYVSELVIFVTPEIVDPSSDLLTERQRELYEVSESRIGAARQSIQLLD